MQSPPIDRATKGQASYAQDQNKPPHSQGATQSSITKLVWHDIITAFLRLRGPVQFQRSDATKVLDMVEDEAKRRLGRDKRASTGIVLPPLRLPTANPKEKTVDQTDSESSASSSEPGHSVDASSRKELPEDPASEQEQRSSKRRKKTGVPNTERRVHEYFSVLEAVQLVRKVCGMLNSPFPCQVLSTPKPSS